MDFLPMPIGCLLVLVMGLFLFLMAIRAENTDYRAPKP